MLSRDMEFSRSLFSCTADGRLSDTCLLQFWEEDVSDDFWGFPVRGLMSVERGGIAAICTPLVDNPAILVSVREISADSHLQKMA